MTIYIKASGEIGHQVNVRISDKAYKIARERNIRFSKLLETALLQEDKGDHYE